MAGKVTGGLRVMRTAAIDFDAAYRDLALALGAFAAA